LFGVAAPHVSPFGGVASYSAAYRQLGPDLKEKTFVVLGTSHYGLPERFGLTRKTYRTPLGLAQVDVPLVDRLARKAPNAVILEDYCHAVEHSIEFQVVFLQHAVAPDIRILPILCGPLFESFQTGSQPDANPDVAAFIGALAEIADSEGDKLFWVLGVDMAHIGQRYGDRLGAQAGDNRMAEVSGLDHARIDRVCAGDTEGFVRLVQAKQDELRWCGYSPFYTFMRTMGQVRPKVQGRMLQYEQWNIDAQSVVSFAAMEFLEDGGGQ
jgi:AmmeMemoRadiSam system protein B